MHVYIFMYARYAEFVQNLQSEFLYRIFCKDCMFEYRRSFTDKSTVSRLLKSYIKIK